MKKVRIKFTLREMEFITDALNVMGYYERYGKNREEIRILFDRIKQIKLHMELDHSFEELSELCFFKEYEISFVNNSMFIHIVSKDGEFEKDYANSDIGCTQAYNEIVNYFGEDVEFLWEE